MTLPTSFLQHVERHGCFTGCFSPDSNVSVCLDPSKPLEPMAVINCQDCLTRMGVPLSLLSTGMGSASLATLLSDHMRVKRGFTLALSGYHARGPGLWLSAVYYGTCGLFLINGERSRQAGSDLDLLLLAFQHGIVQAPDPRMRDPKQFAVSTVHVNFSTHQPTIASKQALLTSPQCRTTSASGWQKVTLAEFLPLSQAPAPPPGAAGPVAVTVKTPSSKALKPGDVCPVCGARICERPLLNGSFVGCLC